MLGFTIVPQAHASVIERLGSFHRAGHSGINFVIPILEQRRGMFYGAMEVDADGKRRNATKKTTQIDFREHIFLIFQNKV